MLLWRNWLAQDAYTIKVMGSSPVSSTKINVPLDKLVKSPPFQGGDCGFESRTEYDWWHAKRNMMVRIFPKKYSVQLLIWPIGLGTNLIR